VSEGVGRGALRAPLVNDFPLFYVPASHPAPSCVCMCVCVCVCACCDVLSWLMHVSLHLLGREAFALMRVHRVDLNLICDLNLDDFVEHVGLFVDQISSIQVCMVVWMCI
jgi:IKI3 family